MRRNFKKNGIAYSILNNFTGEMEIDKNANKKYELLAFSKKENCWTKIGKCNTIAEGYELAETFEPEALESEIKNKSSYTSKELKKSKKEYEEKIKKSFHISAAELEEYENSL